MTTGRTGQTAHTGGMVRPKRLLERRTEHLVAVGTDVGHVSEIVDRYPDPPRNGHGVPDGQRPPQAVGDAQNNSDPLERGYGDPRQHHGPAHFFQLTFLLHHAGYVTNGFNGKILDLLQYAELCNCT